MNGPCFVTWQSATDLTELGFSDTVTLVGHFVSSPREKRREIGDSRGDEKDGQERKKNE